MHIHSPFKNVDKKPKIDLCYLRKWSEHESSLHLSYGVDSYCQKVPE